MSGPVYRSVIVKLSGEALSAANGFGIDQATVERLAADLAGSAKLGVELGVVVETTQHREAVLVEPFTRHDDPIGRVHTVGHRAASPRSGC